MEADVQAAPQGFYLVPVQAVMSVDDKAPRSIMVDECPVCFAITRVSRMEQHRVNCNQDEG